MADEDDLKSLSDDELAKAYVENVSAWEATEHVGRRNRLFGLRSRIVKELNARGTARLTLEQLSQHHDAGVRAAAQSALEYIDRKSEPAPSRQPLQPQRSELLCQCDNPPPPAMTRDEIARRLRHALPEFGDQLTNLMLPAIGLWPQRNSGAIPLTTSRLGGLPLAPPGWEWPTVEDEPLLFIAQINCIDLRRLPGAEPLPGSGVLAFFADHDAVMGCGGADFAVYYWTDIDSLVPATPPIEPSIIFPSCRVIMRPFFDLPHPFSRAVRELNLSKEQTSLYFDEWMAVRSHGMADGVATYSGFSKLLGWPALLQSDLERFEYDEGWRLLLEVDQYCNGEKLHSWGLGGSLYFLLPESDLRLKTLAGCDFDAQFT
jgi:uncharacterized protein YwqG